MRHRTFYEAIGADLYWLLGQVAGTGQNQGDDGQYEGTAHQDTGYHHDSLGHYSLKRKQPPKRLLKPTSIYLLACSAELRLKMIIPAR